LGLDRVRTVAGRMDLLHPACPVFIVGGTNGKGSVCAYLEAMLMAAGFRVGCYTSPHLVRYNERVRLNGVEASDTTLCEALAAVEAARGDIPLTYFEQGTLAAMATFKGAGLDALVLEVGLGGRLDAVNLWDGDCAIVTSVDLDHQAFLGDTREAIGYEKAGIYRSGRPAICGDPCPPASLLDHARGIGAQLLRVGEAIRYESQDTAWTLRVADSAVDGVFPGLPLPAMPGVHQLVNAACAIAALYALRNQLPVPRQAIRLGLTQARQPGRFQIIGHAPLRVLDVAHNPHAARALAANLQALAIHGKGGQTWAVLALLADKDVDGVVIPLLPLVDHWHVATLAGPRGRSGAEPAARLQALGVAAEAHDTVAIAWHAACKQAGPADTICAFGSFHTVAELMMDLEAAPPSHG